MAFDAVSSTKGTSATSYSWSHTLGAGSNRLLAIIITAEDGGTANPGDTPVVAITYGGVTATLQTERTVRSGATAFVGLFTVMEADLTTGAATISVSHSGQVLEYNCCAVSYTDMAQEIPEAEQSEITTAGTTISDTVTTISANALILVGAVHGNGASSSAASGTQRFSDFESSATGVCIELFAGAVGAYSETVTFGEGGNRSAMVMTVFAVDSGGGTTFTQAVAGTATPAGEKTVRMVRTIVGALALMGDAFKSISTVLLGSLGLTGRAFRLFTLTIVGVLSPAGSILKRTAGVISGTMVLAGFAAKGVARSVVGALAISGGATVAAGVQQAVAGTLTLSGQISKGVSKLMIGTLASAGATTKRSAVIVQGLMVSTGAIVKKTLKRVFGGAIPVRVFSAGIRAVQLVAGSLGASGTVTNAPTTILPRVLSLVRRKYYSYLNRRDR